MICDKIFTIKRVLGKECEKQKEESGNDKRSVYGSPSSADRTGDRQGRGAKNTGYRPCIP